MYFCNVNSRYPSCPSITQPNTGEHNSKNCPPFHPNLPENEYDSINHPHRIDENETRLHTQLKSPSSEELEALLQGNSTSNFTAYWQHQLLGKVIENYNMSASTYRARGCPCKPRLVDKKEDFERRSRNGEEVKPQIEEERTRKGSQEVSAEEPSPDKVKVCLPLDLEKLVSKDSSGKTIKLIIYGDKAQCDPGVAKTRDKRASNECLACSLAKHPQIRNLYSGWSDERIDKNSKHWKGIPSKISGAISSKLSFFKKKQKSVMRSCCSDKCAQTCGSPRIDALMGASSKVNKACMCFTKNEKERDSGRGSKATSCQCHSCGKIDLEKLCGANPDCFQNDCLKWVLKMEAKQNYRQVKCIMKELQEQRQEIKDLRKRYTSLLQLRYDQSVKEKTVKCKQDFKMPQKETSDEIVCIRSK